MRLSAHRPCLSSATPSSAFQSGRENIPNSPVLNFFPQAHPLPVILRCQGQGGIFLHPSTTPPGTIQINTEAPGCSDRPIPRCDDGTCKTASRGPDRVSSSHPVLDAQDPNRSLVDAESPEPPFRLRLPIPPSSLATRTKRRSVTSPRLSSPRAASHLGALRRYLPSSRELQPQRGPRAFAAVSYATGCVLTPSSLEKNPCDPAAELGLLLVIVAEASESAQ